MTLVTMYNPISTWDNFAYCVVSVLCVRIIYKCVCMQCSLVFSCAYCMHIHKDIYVDRGGSK